MWEQGRKIWLFKILLWIRRGLSSGWMNPSIPDVTFHLHFLFPRGWGRGDVAEESVLSGRLRPRRALWWLSCPPFPFLLDPEFFSYSLKLLESLLLSLSERLCFLQRAGNVAAPPWLIRGSEPCWAAAISKSLLQWKWVFLSYWSLPESLPYTESERMTWLIDVVPGQAVVIYTAEWSCKFGRGPTAKYEMMALGYDSCW